MTTYRTQSLNNSIILFALGVPMTAEWDAGEKRTYFLFEGAENVNRILDDVHDGNVTVNARDILTGMRRVRALIHAAKPVDNKI